MADKERSKVKWFNEKKGFGFILNPNNGEGDIFVHYRDIIGDGFKTLEPDADVTFNLEKGPKGYKALNVAVIRE